MKKTTFRTAIVALAGAISLASCGDDMTAGGDLTGRIVPSVSLETSLLTAEVGARAGSQVDDSEKTVTVDDLSVTLTSEDGSFSRHWDKLADFPTDYQFPIGNYTFEVAYGDPEAEGFDVTAAYADSDKVTVVEGGAAGVELCATQTQAMVSIVYTDAFKNYLARATVNLTSSSGAINSFVYSPTYTESRPLYVQPGAVTLRADIEKRNGVKATNLDLGGFVAEARRHYHVTVDINEGNVGGTTLQVTFDDQVENREEIEINLSDELLNMPAPEFVLSGFDSPEISFVEGSYPGDKLAVNIIARAGLGSVTLNVKSVYLNDRCGWPVGDFDLMTADAATRSRLTSNGLVVKGLWQNPDEMAVIDFTDALNRIVVIDGTDNTTQVTLSVRDRAGRTTETPLAFSVKVLPVNISLSNASTIYFDQTELTVDMNYNGINPEKNLVAGYLNERGTFTHVSIDKIEPLAKTDNTYRLSLSGLPADNKDITLAVRCGTHMSETLVVKRTPYDFSASVDSADDIFGSMVYMTLASADCDASVLTKYATAYLVYSDGTKTALKTTPVTAPDAIYVEGLTPGVANKIVVSLTGDPAQCCAPVTVTTETPLRLPNNDMENWSFDQLGHYQTLWYADTDKATCAWATMNPLTTSQHGGFNSIISLRPNAAYCATSGTRPANANVDRNPSATANNGNQSTGTNAALVMTVGWGSGNSSLGYSGKCENVTAGELFLGSLDASYNPVRGYAFTSRPNKLTFNAKYITHQAGNGDYGFAEIKVKDADGNVIAEAHKNINEMAEYTNVELKLTYPRGAKKAASIEVNFKSSANPDCIKFDRKYLSDAGSAQLTTQEYTGSRLYIDDIRMYYY